MQPVTPKWLRPFEIFVGLILMASAIIKGYELTLFMNQIAGYRLLPAGMEGAVATAIVMAEAALGVALLAGFVRHGVPHLPTMALLAGFSGIYAYGLAARGIRDCGCFGDFLELAPAVTFIKNAVLVGMLAAAWVARRRLGPLKVATRALVPACVLAVAVLGAFFAGVRQQIVDEAAKEAVTAGPHNVERPYARFVFAADGRVVDLGRGQYLVVWLSTSCPECKKAVAAVGGLRQLIPNLPPVVGLCLGNRPLLEKFRAETKPSFATVLVPTPVFMAFVDVDPPRFCLIRDGQVVAQWDEQLPPNALAEKLGGM